MLQQLQPRPSEGQEDQGWGRAECGVVATTIGLDTAFAATLVAECISQWATHGPLSLDLLKVVAGATAIAGAALSYNGLRKFGQQ